MMDSELWLRKIHRYLGLFVGIQLLLWVVSGIYFVFNDIERVRGNHLRGTPIADIARFEGKLAD
ncbi:MAG: hypothetical protein MI865_11840, partial [Proteobacteria bacterium]|nr:hypothetical protein [Pseudomonadota bacterium]